MTARILVVEGDPTLVRSLQIALSSTEYELLVAGNCMEARNSVRTRRPDIAVVDFIPPRPASREICREMRTGGIPVIAVSEGYGDLDRRILDGEADDFIMRPFGVNELFARIRAVQRRATPAAPPGIITAGMIEMDIERWTTSVAGTPVALTTKEHGLLRALLEAGGRILSRESALEVVWGHENAHRFDTRTVDVHIGRLRRKLGPAGRYLITVRNAGYRVDNLREMLDAKRG